MAGAFVYQKGAVMTVYLLHFDVPIGDPSNSHGMAQHYMGCSDNLEERLKAHRHGYGAAIMAAVSRAGIDWQLARTWDGGRDLERQLKRRKNARFLCPLCRQMEAKE